MAEHQARIIDATSRLRVVRETAPADEAATVEEPQQLPGSPDGRRPRRRGRFAILLLVAAAALSLAAYTGVRTLSRGGGQASAPLRITAALPYWNVAKDASRIVANSADFSEVSQWMYGLSANGGIEMLPVANAQAARQALDEIRSSGLPLVPTIANIRDGKWDYATIIAILRSPQRRAQHIADIVRLATDNDYAGVDIDYEDFQGADRDVFTSFVTELATALHAKGKTLSVDVFAKTDDRGYDQRNIAQDYHAIGAAADTVRIMAYDWHWNGSDAGPIAPLNWVRSVVHYALTQMPRRKIVLGVPSYGYDWVGTHANLVSWLQVYNLAERYGAQVRWDDLAQSPWLAYQDSRGVRHVVWFENAYSTMAKLALARNMGVGGVYLWLAGDEDDLMWRNLRASVIDKAAQQVSRGQGVTAK